MTAPLGSTTCPFLGCMRKRHVSPSGIRYGTCLTHATELLSRAFSSRQDDAQQGAGPVAASPERATATGPLLIGVLPTTAAVRG
jgi:hypothetical protein